MRRPRQHPRNLGISWSLAVLAVVPVALTGCDLFEPSRRNLTVSLSVQGAMPSARLHATVGERVVVLRADAGGSAFRDLSVQRRETLPVTVALLDLDGDTLASVALEQSFEGSNHDHWISTVVGTQRPVGFCIGALSAAALTAGSDSLFVMHGSIPRGAIC